MPSKKKRTKKSDTTDFQIVREGQWRMNMPYKKKTMNLVDFNLAGRPDLMVGKFGTKVQ